jgi:hypothetical protein
MYGDSGDERGGEEGRGEEGRGVVMGDDEGYRMNPRVRATTT